MRFASFTLLPRLGADIFKAPEYHRRHDGHRTYSNLTDYSPFAYQWARMYEDPNLAGAWAVVDADTKADIEALLFDSSTSAADESRISSSSGLSMMPRRAITVTIDDECITIDDEGIVWSKTSTSPSTRVIRTTISAVITRSTTIASVITSTISSKSEGTRTSDDEKQREERIKELEKEVRKKKQQDRIHELERQLDATSRTSSPTSEEGKTEDRDKDRQKKIEALEKQLAEKRIEALERKLKEMEKQQKDGTSFVDEAGRQDCGFGPLTAETWKESGAHAALKVEMDEWKDNGDGKSFHAYMFGKYALGLAPSLGHCNGRGFCSPISCHYVDVKLPVDKRKKMYFIMEAIARRSRITDEENDVLKNTLALLSGSTVNIVNDYTPLIAHDKVRDAKNAYDAEQAKEADWFSLIFGGIIPMFCCFVPGGGMMEKAGDMIEGAVGTGMDKAGERIGKRLGPIVGSGIGTTVAISQSYGAMQWKKKTAEIAGESPIQEVVVTLANYQRQMSTQIETFQNMMLDRAEMLLNGTTFDGHNLYTDTEGGHFLNINIDNRRWLQAVEKHVKSRVLSSMINHAWRSNYAYIAMSDVDDGDCADDDQGAPELRICLPEVRDKVFYIFRYDDAFANRNKDGATSPNGWSKLPHNLDITLDNIVRASYAWFENFEYEDYDKVDLNKILQLQKTGGPLYGAFNIPITYNPGGESISQVADPVKMVGDWEEPEAEHNRGPCISGASWSSGGGGDDNSEEFIRAVGLFAHPSFHERCRKNAECEVDDDTVFTYDGSSNLRIKMPWSDEECAQEDGKHIPEDDEHWCGKDFGRYVVKMKAFTKCEGAPITAGRYYTPGHVPE